MRPSRRAIQVVAALLLLAACGGATSASPRAVTITLTDASTTPTIELATSASVYLTIRSSAKDEIVGATVASTVAAFAMVEGVATGGAGHLGHLDGPSGKPHTHTPTARISVPAGVPLTLQPAVGRIVLRQLSKPLIIGDRFTMLVAFASGTTQEVEVVTRTDAAA